MTVLYRTGNTNLVAKEVVWLIETVADSFYEMQKAGVTCAEASLHVPSQSRGEK
jgi:hypothetical protein